MVARPAAVSTTLSGWLQGLMWATGGLALITGVVGFLALGAFEDYTDTRFGTSAERRAFADWSDLNDAFDAVNGVLTLVWIGLFVVTIVWMNKAHKATQRLWSGPRKWSSGWTVGGWFIPFANFFIPKKVLNEIERISKAPRMGGMVDYRWHQESTSAIGWLWWIGTSVGIVFRTIGAAVFDDVSGSDDEITGGYTMQALGSFVAAAGLVLGALFIRRLARRLSPQGIVEVP